MGKKKKKKKIYITDNTTRAISFRTLIPIKKEFLEKLSKEEMNTRDFFEPIVLNYIGGKNG